MHENKFKRLKKIAIQDQDQKLGRKIKKDKFELC